ncbi:FkbM family methyltransferase [Fibrella forsythiae]|uniref:FkbM family methyltransferase n=1 Tax=Fibrella forsythiae TaxID=2817061 RepID=A0ABS3JQN9_9BACT|nr:FkbM family methyltransferase [Fibrella forsythiae]MBO0952312.1 FkbM family methyltransferase [Fibrella forsythiae]
MKKIINLLTDYQQLRLKYIQKKLFPTANQRLELVREKIQREKMIKFYGNFIKAGDLCFDVGANLGNRIEPFLSLSANVVAVEPQEACARFLRHKFNDQIELEVVGLGESEGTKDFYIADTHTLSTFSSEWINTMKQHRFEGYNWRKPVKLTMTTLDKLIARYGVPAFIKIDVEGYELNVLNGLSEPVQMISFEYAVPEQTEKLIACIDRVSANKSTIECNFCVSETMEFALPEWLTPNQMKTYIQTSEFSQTDFGDIYIRLKL